MNNNTDSGFETIPVSPRPPSVHSSGANQGTGETLFHNTYIPYWWYPLYRKLGLSHAQVRSFEYAITYINKDKDGNDLQYKTGIIEWNGPRVLTLTGIEESQTSRAKSILKKAGLITLLRSGQKGGPADIFDATKILTMTKEDVEAFTWSGSADVEAKALKRSDRSKKAAATVKANKESAKVDPPAEEVPTSSQQVAEIVNCDDCGNGYIPRVPVCPYCSEPDSVADNNGEWFEVIAYNGTRRKWQECQPQQIRMAA